MIWFDSQKWNVKLTRNDDWSPFLATGWGLLMSNSDSKSRKASAGCTISSVGTSAHATKRSQLKKQTVEICTNDCSCVFLGFGFVSSWHLPWHGWVFHSIDSVSKTVRFRFTFSKEHWPRRIPKPSKTPRLVAAVSNHGRNSQSTKLLFEMPMDQQSRKDHHCYIRCFFYSVMKEAMLGAPGGEVSDPIWLNEFVGLNSMLGAFINV